MICPSIDESVSLGICLLTVAYNREIQPFLCLLSWLDVVGVKIFSGLGRLRALNLTVLLGSDDLGYESGSGFNFKPVQTFILEVDH